MALSRWFVRWPRFTLLVLLAFLAIWAYTHTWKKPGEITGIEFRSDRLPDPVSLTDGDQTRNVTGFILRFDFLDEKNGSGTITLEEDILTFNDFGDATRTSGKEVATYPIQLRFIEEHRNWGRKLYEVVFADGRLRDQLRLVRFPEPATTHRLIVKGEVTRFLELRGPKIEPDALGDNQQPDRFHFETLALEKNHRQRKDEPTWDLKRITVRGSLSGEAYLDLDPNYLDFNSFGDIQGTTCIGWTTIPIIFKLLGEDPTHKGRRAFELIAKKFTDNRSYVLVVAPTELGPHRLIIKEEGKVRQVLPLRDRERDNHLFFQPGLAKVPAEESEAIVQLRKMCGYQFGFSLDKGHVETVSLLHGDIARIDPILKTLKQLKALHFSHAKLTASGLNCLKGMPNLGGLNFYFCEIADEGLAFLKDSTNLKLLIFFGSQGPTARGLAHFEKLTNLQMLEIRREDAPKDLPILDDGLKNLKGMKKLTWLNLHGQRITDAGLAPIGTLTNLEELVLSGDLLTEAGLKHLEGLPNLRRLWLYGFRISPQAWKAFKAKLPKLKETFGPLLNGQ